VSEKVTLTLINYCALIKYRLLLNFSLLSTILPNYCQSKIIVYFVTALKYLKSISKKVLIDFVLNRLKNH